MKKYYLIILTVFIWSVQVFADGLMMPVNENYPKNFLRNRLTHVNVKIHGQVAETFVYQEFENEWTDSTDAVYSFPLPADARATEFVYWHKDKAYKAILKVKEQATNPGTGEGGIVAEVNKYIGRNGIKVHLKGIQAGEIQQVRLHYISQCDYYRGKNSYHFPLNTADFIKYQIDHLQFNFEVISSSDIQSFELTDGLNYRILENNPNRLRLEVIQPKAYLNRHVDFSYQCAQDEMGVDLYSITNDSTPGHFTLFVRPEHQVEPDSVIPKRVFFLLSNSTSMFGYKLEQSISAISTALDRLYPFDYFNILVFNYTVNSWQSQAVEASSSNIEAAKNFLAGIKSASGTRMDLAIDACFNQIKDSDHSNSIIIFSDGMSPLDPRTIESDNIHKAAIFPIAIGDDISYARLEMLAVLNYGFVTYIDPQDNISAGMERVLSQINQPVLKDVQIEYGMANLSQIVPEKVPATYAGSSFFMAGRYENSGASALSIAGQSVEGPRVHDFSLTFSDQHDPEYKFAEYIWAKQMIDALEWDIEIYGEAQHKKDRLIELSLKYNIRCRYTAYIADYETKYTTITTGEQQPGITPQGCILAGNYPNPFNPETNIKVYINDTAIGKAKLLKIYNILGQLVAVIDISHLHNGWHSIRFVANDMFGNPLPSGIYFVRLQVSNNLHSTIRIHLLK